MAVEMGMVDHLGCLAVLTRAGGRTDLALTLLQFRNNIILGLDSIAEDTFLYLVARFEGIVNEMMLVRLTFEEASALWASRN